jgi:hypothetical protein
MRSAKYFGFPNLHFLIKPVILGCKDIIDVDIVLQFYQLSQNGVAEKDIQKEISSIMGIKYDNVRKRISRIRKRYDENKNKSNLVDFILEIYSLYLYFIIITRVSHYETKEDDCIIEEDNYIENITLENIHYMLQAKNSNNIIKALKTISSAFERLGNSLNLKM